MGRTYLFTCAKCEYRARVSGGADSGEHLSVQTIACEDCRALYDAVVKMRIQSRTKNETEEAELPKVAPKFPVALNRLSPHLPRRWLKFKPACPVSPRHHITIWQKPGRCPKCGAYMEQEALPFRLWD